MSKQCCSYYVPFITSLLFKIGGSVLSPVLLLFLYESVCRQLIASEQASQTIHEHRKTFERYWKNGQTSMMANYGQSNITLTCDNLSEEDQNIIQMEASNYLIGMKILQNIPAFVMCLFCGGWMDRIGLRLPIMLCSLGGVIVMVMLVFIQAISGSAIPGILAAATIYAIVGPNLLIPAGVEAYISSTTSKTQRTLQMGFVVATNYVGLVTGSMIIALLVDVVPFWVLFLIVAVFFLSTFLLVLIALPETPTVEGNENEKMSCLRKVAAFYQLDNLRGTMETFTRQRPDNMRRHLFITLACISLKTACKAGEIDVLLFFVRHSPLNWTKAEFGYVLAFHFAVAGLMLIFLLPVILKYVKLNDPVIVVGFSIAKAFGLCLLAFSDHTWMVYVATIFIALYGILTSCLRSMLSKIVNSEETGRCFNIVASIEVVSELLGVIMFTRMYYYGLELDSPYGRSIPFFVMGAFHILISVLAFYVGYTSGDLFSHEPPERPEKPMGHYAAIERDSVFDEAQPMVTKDADDAKSDEDDKNSVLGEHLKAAILEKE